VGTILAEELIASRLALQNRSSIIEEQYQAKEADARAA
jgi:hypothetical protein